MCAVTLTDGAKRLRPQQQGALALTANLPEEPMETWTCACKN
jgi:hypothetical protein